jgi:hypothetical protein
VGAGCRLNPGIRRCQAADACRVFRPSPAPCPALERGWSAAGSPVAGGQRPPFASRADAMVPSRCPAPSSGGPWRAGVPAHSCAPPGVARKTFVPEASLRSRGNSAVVTENIILRRLLILRSFCCLVRRGFVHWMRKAGYCKWNPALTPRAARPERQSAARPGGRSMRTSSVHGRPWQTGRRWPDGVRMRGWAARPSDEPLLSCRGMKPCASWSLADET